MISLGKVEALSSSLKQKINMKRSTEWELVGARDGLIIVLRRKHFIEAQG